ncbi:DUF7537 family lipoprotein [Haloarcula salinisoli]|uniref:Lipoprotein n=1 Tax=Haloarcula salinisoli TaxID=2487746 RepID=A0A8J7YGF8_9EURY|nr:hypothetical protein [Halomicroarcula salinisoli]MBX0305047.1 hypothetical protein [Halomicroarcula salinisoli]
MRKIATILVVLTVLLAGCNTGGTGGTPTATGTADSNESAPTMEGSINDLDGVENGEVTNVSSLLDTFYGEGLSGYVDFDFSAEEKNSGYTVGYRNDTKSQLYEISTTNQSGKTIYYVHNGTDAKRNTTTGETTYGEQRFASFVLFVPSIYVSTFEVMEWETAGTTTVDGEPRYVLESSSINDTAAERQNSSFRSSNTTVDARVTVDSDGIIRSGQMNISTTEDSATMTFTLDTSESITVTQPDWYDEAEAQAESSSS